MDDMNHRRLLIGIAHDYYLSKINIAEISKKYQVSRYLISKYLDEAMATGLVKININTPSNEIVSWRLNLNIVFQLNIFILSKTRIPRVTMNAT
ncbi:hypothetical protein TUA1478L_00760 [Lactiplantibacillus plantarum]